MMNRPAKNSSVSHSTSAKILRVSSRVISDQHAGAEQRDDRRFEADHRVQHEPGKDQPEHGSDLISSGTSRIASRSLRAMIRVDARGVVREAACGT